MNRNQLKALAAAAMLLDHIALAFLPQTGAAYFALRFLGRITGPVMAFFIAEGYLHTRNVRRYSLRLLAFALLSWVPYAVFETGSPTALFPHFSVLHTLLLGLLAVWLWDKGPYAPLWKALGILLLCALALPGDWSFYNVLFVLVFFICRDSPKEKWLAYSLLAAVMILSNMTSWFDLYRLGMFLVPPLVQYGYNGHTGRKTALSKWGFYAFYPAHLLILGLLRY